MDDSGFAREDDATSEYWDNFGIVEESLLGLSLETSVTTQPEEPIITGRRVVSLAHFVNAVRSLDDHSCPKLTGRFALVKERRVGLWSELTFTCSECQEIRKLTTDPVTEPTSLTDKANVGVNDAAVWAFMSIGSGHSQFEEAMAVMEIPAMSKGAFLRREESLGKVNKLINIYFLFLKTMEDVQRFIFSKIHVKRQWHVHGKRFEREYGTMRISLQHFVVYNETIDREMSGLQVSQ